MKKFFIAIIGIFSINSFAANPFTDCGIGAALFPNTDWAAVTSNVIWDVGTTAMISATASEDTCSGGEAQTAKLIHDKLEGLETEIMIGSGDIYAALASSMQCGNADISKEIKASYVSVLNNDSYATNTRIKKSESLYTMLKNNDAVQKHCSVFS
tara:strand:- start:117 stop:581 length:465 start_codon:yes stop_codon:yes gene_type:complete